MLVLRVVPLTEVDLVVQIPVPATFIVAGFPLILIVEGKVMIA